MSLDLTGIKDYVEAELMDDEVRIFRDPEREQDDEWDPETMTYTPPDDDEDLIYQGKCWISPVKGQADEASQAAQDVVVKWYNLNLPLEAPVLFDYDLVECIVATRDPHLAGAEFLVKTEEVGTFKIKRKVSMQRVTRVT